MESWPERIRQVRVGLLFVLLAALYGFGLGAAFGAFEDGIKGHLRSESQAVLASAYGGDEAAMKKVSEKSWTYFKRAHLHANGLSALSLGLILLLTALDVNARGRALTAAALGVGSLGYAMYWMLAGLKAPGMGGTGAAKEALEWLAIPSSGLCIVGLLAALVFTVRSLFVARSSAENGEPHEVSGAGAAPRP